MHLFPSPASPLLFAATVTEHPVPVCLFEAGEYPDRGITVTPEDLDQVVSRFNSSDQAVLVNTEHRVTPLDPLGEVVGVYHKNGKLYGAIVFSAGIQAHIKARDAGKFSVGFRAHDDGGFVLDHVAVTATPRVTGTGFLNPAQVAESLAKFSKEGKLTPAMMEPAARLLSAPGIVRFSDGSEGLVAADVVALLDALPAVLPRGSAVPANFARTNAADGLSPEQARMADRFGVDSKRVAATISGERI